MKLPVIKGVIKRRILMNYQIEPEVIVKYLPPIFKPKVIQGKSIIGVCLIRLEQIHPKSFRTSMGISSENAAHRIAVQWNDETGKLCDGVYIFRRDTNSRLNYLLGGRLFPGEHHRAKFIVNDSEEKINFQLISTDMCLIPHEWNMSPLECNNLELSYFRNMGISDEEIQLDSVVIMRDIAHEWQSLKTMV
jgi:hypothetical protein